MKSWLKKVVFGVGCLAVWSFYAMEEPIEHIVKTRTKIINGRSRDVLYKYYPGEHTHLYQFVSADKLDVKAFFTSDYKAFLEINKKDRNGCTPLHHLMIHKEVTVDLVAFFIKQGARLDIKNKDGENPYHYALAYDEDVKMGMSDKVERSCFDNIKVINFVHSEMLRDKLLIQANNQCRQGQITKKSSFYEIT